MIYLGVSLIFLLGTAVTLTVFMSVYLLVRKKRRQKYGKWNHMSDLLVRKAIFFDEDDKHHIIPITTRLNKLLANQRFRHHLTRKIVSASRSLSGQSFRNLQRLYIQLGLDKFALKMAESSQWHKKSHGLQQIGAMELTEHLNLVSRFTNDKNDLVRVEAQIAVLKLSGFEGLRFLDNVSYQISEWQQIRLLKELSQLPHTELKGVDHWLRSDNASVIIFALKLARNYHHFELYDDIMLCLDHPQAEVRAQAVLTLSDIYTENTSDRLVEIFPGQPVDIQLVIAKVLAKIGDREDVPALINFLSTSHLGLKLALVRTLFIIGEGTDLLEQYVDTNVYPINEMVAQVKNEMK
ncbi:HEAT repeat domain-containing protein [Pedobacter deserti]|uniref:HEAT repeat domain-containing protein n=1 Tax=Pedobacter deserti TaxID=2817382 RepID=UPI00210C5839|nr:HEAT repeat domain-containing protein [Pedobacter sp. SYSU D00382]